MTVRSFALVLAVWGVSSCMVVRADDPMVASPRLPDSSPWDLETLAKVPAVEWSDEASPVRSLLYSGEPFGGKPTRVFAYYSTPGILAGVPDADRDLPAVVLVHGGGGTAFREWVELWARRGYAAIAMDLAGQRPIEGRNPHPAANRQRLPDGGPNQGDDEKFGAIDKAVGEQWSYHAVANVIRAHSLIRSFPEVNRDRTAITGISWGGYLTCIVAGLDNRFAAAVPVYGCGFLHENSAWLDRLASLPAEQRQRWVRLWDPSAYLPAVTMPILFVNGTNDFAYPLDSYLKSYRVVNPATPEDKQIRVTVNMPHGHQAGWAPDEIDTFIGHHLSGSLPLPSVDEPMEGDGIVTLSWQGPAALSTATLHFTTDDGAINQRIWHDREATIDGAKVRVDGPPDDATAWFITVRDQRGLVISSVVVMR